MAQNSILKTSELEAPTRHKLIEVFDGQNKARAGKGISKKPAAAAAATAVAASHDVDFVHLWRQLTAAGWKSKRPIGIETEWRYSSPVKTHVFVGESAVVNFAFESGFLKDREEEDTVQEEEVVRPSQVDTSVVLLQNTVDGIFCSSSDIDVELSQAAVTRAFGLSLGNLQDHDDGSDGADAAAGLHMLSEASGLESGGELDDEQADLVAEQAVGLPFRRRLQEVKDDANMLQDGEDSCDYVNYSSGVSDDDGMCDDEVEPGCGQLSNDEDVLSDSDAVEMDTAFLASLQEILSNEYENDPDLGSGSDDQQFAGRSSEFPPVCLAVGMEASGTRRGSGPPDSVDRLEAVERLETAEFAVLRQELALLKAQLAQVVQTASNVQVDLGSKLAVW
ncbi:unnamed protein product [Phytophthora fragariaefolia]|uniref:Unnamed protein product n=1 Tax=Phytophthora fragariaefolia TaxID=1490495 RepID=A0A9W7CWP5_9STRA|nr:unnamed protein product [Phytophthora fragariaefolia]